MKAEYIVNYVLKHAANLHPEYSHEQRLVWALGFVASICSEKNHMDNIVWMRVEQRINELYKGPAASD